MGKLILEYSIGRHDSFKIPIKNKLVNFEITYKEIDIFDLLKMEQFANAICAAEKDEIVLLKMIDTQTFHHLNYF